MKVLGISNFYPPHFEGGYEISVQESLDYLAEQGHQIFVLCGHRGVDQPAKCRLDFEHNPIQRVLKYIDYHHASFLNKHLVERHNYRCTREAIAELLPDIVYFGSLKAISIAPALAVQKLQVPRIYDIGDDWLKTYSAQDFSSRVFRWLKRKLPGFVGGKVHLDPVIVPSQWMAAELKNLYGCKDLHIVPRAIALPKTYTRPLSRPLQFLFAGRIEPLKGVDLILQAAHIISIDNPDFSVDIYGEGDTAYLDSCLEQLRKYQLQRQINFKGKSQHLPALLPAYDVLLMPTLAKETFGRIIIEAMAAGLIVIATRAYGPAEIISEGVDGFLFERADARALAKTITELIHTPLNELEHIRKLAYQKVAAHYEISLVKKSIAKILESELKKSEAKMRQT